jgi:sulfur-carrier protein
VTAQVRVALPAHLRTIARVAGDVVINVPVPVTLRSVLDAVEEQYPALRGTIRDHVTYQRRPFVRYFACERDFSLDPPDTPLPEAVASGKEPFLIVGAIAGGRRSTGG